MPEGVARRSGEGDRGGAQGGGNPGRDGAGRAAPPPAATGWRDEFAALCGRVIVLGGFWSLVSLLLRPVRWVRRVDDLFGLVNLPVGPSLFSIVLLFVIGGAVRRRIRFAWWLLLAFQTLAALYLAARCCRWCWSTASDARDITVLDGVELVGQRRPDRGAGGAALAQPAARSRPGWNRARAGWRWACWSAAWRSRSRSSIALTLSFPDTLVGIGAQARLGGPGRPRPGAEPAPRSAGTASTAITGSRALAGLLSALALVAAALVFLRSARAKAYLTAQDELDIRRLLLQSRRARLARLLRHPARQVGDLHRRPQRRGHLPGAGQRSAWPAPTRSGRRRPWPAAIAGLAGRGPLLRLVPGRAVGQRGGRRGLRRGRPEGAADRRRGDHRRRHLHPRGPDHAAGPAGGAPGRSGPATRSRCAGTAS